MKKRLLSLLLAVLMLCSLAPGASALLPPVLSGNVQYQSYHDASGLFSRWAMPVWSYLHPCAEGMERVEYIPHGSGMQLIAEQYTMDGEIVGRKEIPIELPIFGGFFAGSDANFVVFGQKNADNSDAAEIIRVVRYAYQEFPVFLLVGRAEPVVELAGKNLVMYLVLQDLSDSLFTGSLAVAHLDRLDRLPVPVAGDGIAQFRKRVNDFLRGMDVRYRPGRREIDTSVRVPIECISKIQV